TICAAGPTVYTALDAAATLEAEGVAAEVIDLRSLSPWDKETVLESVAKTGRFIAVDESFPTCSAASEWAATVAEEAFHQLRAPVQRVTNKDVPMPFSPVLEKAVLPSQADVIAAVHKTLA
ncbi:MAG: alpha-ketoacid dehydrogenase subunit beta, partial [Chloroflexi bacterium]|nr:alpha-ketoacid dehydrogenase subunit beta [Chloroflexota bacterium]